MRRVLPTLEKLSRSDCHGASNLSFETPAGVPDVFAAPIVARILAASTIGGNPVVAKLHEALNRG